MSIKLKSVKDLRGLLQYFSEVLHWPIEFETYESFAIEDVTYDFDASYIGLKEEEFSIIRSLLQLRPLSDNQPWGIFAVEFDSKRLEVSALRKILSALIPRRRQNNNHAVWDKHDLIFLCFWGNGDYRTVGIVHFEDKECSLATIKIIHSALQLEDSSQIAIFEDNLQSLLWPQNPTDIATWKNSWSKAFPVAYRQVIHDSRELTFELAKAARFVQQRIISIFSVESVNGYLHLLYEKFKTVLIHGITEAQFADMYAQTVVYGLLLSRCMDTTKNDFNPQEAIELIPNTNPFLKSVLRDCFNQDYRQLSFDALGLNDIIEVLARTNVQQIMRDFNRQTGGGREDPVYLFYEQFLAAYENIQKIQRGVFYTPQPVVKFIVGAVDEIIRKEFGLNEGLASSLNADVASSGKQPLIQILDPATGTGTFLRETILRIYQQFCTTNKTSNRALSDTQLAEKWNQYVSRDLLPRLFGFELMMAPYAIAHMKLAMVLKETGYDFSNDERLRVYLTNSLEGPTQTRQCDISEEDALAKESIAASEVKVNNRISVVFGNPPYRTDSSNSGEWIMSLMKDYKYEPGTTEKLRERNPKVVNDDYVKFIRLAQYFIHNNSSGIIAFINPHSFIDNLTFRGFRWTLLQEFDEIYVLDLHGNVMKNEVLPSPNRDENIFDITQGVSINIFVKRANINSSQNAKVFYYDVAGSRDDKISFLLHNSFGDIAWREVKPTAPYYFFIQKDFANQNKYELGIKVSDLFPIRISGIKTHDDGHLVSVNQFNTGFDALYDYRPFDIRHINYDRSKVSRHRYPVMKHLYHHENMGLVINRQAVTNNWSHIQIVRNMIDNRLHYSNRGIPEECPMYLYDDDFDGLKRKPNVNMEIVHNIEQVTGLSFVPESNNISTCFSMTELFDYVYAVLNCPSYIQEYLEFLKIDFPRVPYPKDKYEFLNLVSYGKQLRELHFMESPILDELQVEFPYNGNNTVEIIAYHDDSVYINPNQAFIGVPQSAWEFFFGGYQPAQKWLKDRKNKRLSDDEILHYRKMITIFIETDRISNDIEEFFLNSK